MSSINLSDYITVGIISQGESPIIKVRKIDSNKELALKKIKTTDFQKHLSYLQSTIHLSACCHPNILQILGFSVIQSPIDLHNKIEYTLCILTEIHDRTLENDIQNRAIQKNYYTLQEITKITQQLSDSLIYLQNELKIAHRDIKPSNILINSSGDYILADFTESFQQTELNTQIKQIVGTPFYMAPELKEFFIKGEENCDLKNYNPWKSDVYSLGITLLECSELLICNNNIKSPDSFKRITEYYGDDFSHLLKLLIENFEIRPDFSELVFKEQYQAFFHVNNKNKNTIDTNKEGINESVSQEFKRLIEELKVSCDIDDDTEKEFEFALEKARNIEKQNLELKQRYNFSQENKKKNNFSDNLKMAEKKVSNTQ